MSVLLLIALVFNAVTLSIFVVYDTVFCLARISTAFPKFSFVPPIELIEAIFAEAAFASILLNAVYLSLTINSNFLTCLLSSISCFIWPFRMSSIVIMIGFPNSSRMALPVYSSTFAYCLTGLSLESFISLPFSSVLLTLIARPSEFVSTWPVSPMLRSSSLSYNLS